MELTEEEIEEIINSEIIVDCYSVEEAKTGWAIYMEQNIHYPFEAEYLVKKKSGEKKWEKVRVINNETNESSFGKGAFYVEIELGELIVTASLDGLREIKANKETMRTLQVWRKRFLI